MPASGVRISLAVAIGVLLAPAFAGAAVPHTVEPGETLWSIAAQNNFTTRTIAAYNGLAEDAQVSAGETIEIPTEAEGATAVASTGLEGSPSGGSAASPTASAGTPAPPPGSTPPSWVAPIYCPCGDVYLASNAAAAWNAMRQESLRLYGIDLYPAGPLSAYRSYTQQAYLWDLYVSGQAPPAAPPGTSAHEYGTAIDLADPSMADVVDLVGATYGWGKTEAPEEWWHVNYIWG